MVSIILSWNTLFSGFICLVGGMWYMIHLEPVPLPVFLYLFGYGGATIGIVASLIFEKILQKFEYVDNCRWEKIMNNQGIKS